MIQDITNSIFEKYDLIDIDETFPIPELPEKGLILLCGSSGSGKSTILKHYFNLTEVFFDNRPIYLNFSSEAKAEELLISCGLRTIPTWKRPFNTLSNGEQHRAKCAKVLDCGLGYIDEFTSVVDRNTAKALSYAMQKYFKKSDISRLVIASCHTDIIEWLNPDYTYNTDTKRWVESNLPRGCLRRPSINLTIRSEKKGEDLWEIFRKYHYLSASYNKAANAFAAEIEGKIVGMTAILRYPSGTVKGAWREHRTVVLPEFQGLGIGTALSETVAQVVVNNRGRFFSKTSHPAFGEHRNSSPKWRPTSKNQKKRNDYNSDRVTKESKHKKSHAGRLCYSHEYIGIKELSI